MFRLLSGHSLKSVGLWKKTPQFHSYTFCENKSDNPKPLGFVAADSWCNRQLFMNPQNKMCFSCTTCSLGKDRTLAEERFLYLGFHLYRLFSMSLFVFAELCGVSRFLEVLALSTREKSSLLLCFVYFYLFFDNLCVWVSLCFHSDFARQPWLHSWFYWS